MTQPNILFVGMDVHKESIEIALADGANQEVRRYGKTGGARDAMRMTLVKDLADGYGAVWLPHVLARKYPNAATQWGWQYVFPAATGA